MVGDEIVLKFMIMKKRRRWVRRRLVYISFLRVRGYVKGEWPFVRGEPKKRVVVADRGEHFFRLFHPATVIGRELVTFSADINPLAVKEEPHNPRNTLRRNESPHDELIAE